MQIVETAAAGLSRTYGVTVPAADLARRLDAKARELAPQVQVRGFRKGKVPPTHVRRMYGKALMGDLVNETLQAGIDRALSGNGIRPASQPQLRDVCDLDAVVAGTLDLTFSVAFEIMPEFEPADVKSLEVIRVTAQPAEAEIDEALARLAEQTPGWKAKKGKAADGDSVICDFVGKLDGAVFEGGSAEDANIVLGSGSYIPGFESGLAGVKAGDTRTLDIVFPADYQAAHLAGKAAQFDVTVKEVRARQDSKVDDELAKALGLSDLAQLRDAVAGNLRNELSALARQKAKRDLLDRLDAAHDFELPPGMVAAEFDGIWNQVEADRANGEVDPEDAGKSDEDLKAEYRKIAERRVRLGLVLAEIGRFNDIQVTDEELNRALQREAMRFPGQERQVVEYLQKTPGAVAQLRAPIYEEKVVDFIFDNAKATEIAATRVQLESDEPLIAADAKPAKAKAAAKAPAKAKAAKAEPAAEPVAKPEKAKAPAKPKAAKAEPAVEPAAEPAAKPAKAAAAKPKAPKKS